MDDTAWPRAGVHQGRVDCADLLRQALLGLAPAAAAPWGGARTLWLADPDFADWPLDEPAVHDALGSWLRQGGRQLRMAGLHFDKVERRHPRLARWRRDWSHAISVVTPVEGDLPPELRGLLVAPLWLQWMEAPDFRLRCSTDMRQARLVDASIADFLQRCEPAWPATTLGL
jgi:hypothetical protein